VGEKPDSYEVGQQWAAIGRTDDEQVVLTIGRLEQYPEGGHVIHVHCAGCVCKNPRSIDGFTREIMHLPLSLQAFEDGLGDYLGEADVPEKFEKGYDIWRNGDQINVMDAPIPAILDYVEDTFCNPQSMEHIDEPPAIDGEA
jgi:hypothetical protein